MKLSFTTLGCPDWDLDTIIDRSAEYGFDGIDFRGVLGEMDIFRMPEFSDRVDETRRKVEQAGLEVSCFSSSVKLFATDPAEMDRNRREIAHYGRLCKQFGTSFIRVFGGSIGGTDRDEAVNIVVRHARQLAEIAQQHGAKLILETHDDWTACADVQTVTDAVDTDGLAVLWDVHHPYRTLGEQPHDTWKTLGDRIVYTHWKDSALKPEHERGFQYCLMGEGDVPLRDMYTVCTEGGYDGWYTFEWEKRWHPYIEEPEVSFPQYVRYMREVLAGSG